MHLNQIYNENCMHTLERMPDGFLDMTLTSPPYDDLRAYEGFDFSASKMAEVLLAKTKPGGVVVWVVADRTANGSETLTSFTHAITFSQAGWRVNDTMIYAKNNPIPSDCGTRYRQCFEYIFCFSKGRPKTFNPIMQEVRKARTFRSFRITKKGRNDLALDRETPKRRKVNNIFYYNVGSSSSKDKIAFQHPAIFPEQLAHDQIKTWSNAGDIVYDPFMGSGTTAKAAIQLERHWIGSEISQAYVLISHERLMPYLAP
jgi:DNA modification methylase